MNFDRPIHAMPPALPLLHCPLPLCSPHPAAARPSIQHRAEDGLEMALPTFFYFFLIYRMSQLLFQRGHLFIRDPARNDIAKPL